MLGCISRSKKSYFKREIYEELGLQSLHYCRRHRKLSYFYKFYKNELPQYLFKLISVGSSEYSTSSMQNDPFFKTRHNVLKNISFWQPLYNGTSRLDIFRKNILKFIALSPDSVLNSHNPKVIELITRQRLVQIHLPEHKFSLFSRFTKSNLQLRVGH